MRVFMMTLTMTAILGLTMAQPVLAGQGKISQDIAEACEGAINKDECVRELSENTQLQVMFGNKGYATKMCEHP